MSYKVAKDATGKAMDFRSPDLSGGLFSRTDKEISLTTRKGSLLPPTRKDKPNKQSGMQTKCNNCACCNV